MAGALLKALDRGEFRLLFQPKLDLATGNISGVEALLRWHSTDLGDIPPAVFIPIAEETALIVPIGEWVLREALITLKRWRHSGLTDITMAVNVSVLQLLRANQIGSESCRERVCQYVLISVVAVSLKKKKKRTQQDKTK